LGVLHINTSTTHVYFSDPSRRHDGVKQREEERYQGKVAIWSNVCLHILMKVSMLVESYCAAKIRIIVITIFSNNWYQSKILAVLLIHIMGSFFF